METRLENTGGAKCDAQFTAQISAEAVCRDSPSGGDGRTPDLPKREDRPGVTSLRVKWKMISRRCMLSATEKMESVKTLKRERTSQRWPAYEGESTKVKEKRH